MFSRDFADLWDSDSRCPCPIGKEHEEKRILLTAD